MQASPIICIAGPTASGKTDLAINVANRLDGEILSADSMQVYRGMDIGTAKVDIAYCNIKHYGINIVDPDMPYSAALFQKYGRDAIDEIISNDKQPIICGGTGFYIRAVIDNYNFAEGEQINNPIRNKYTEMLEVHGAHRVWDALNEIDPQSAQIIHPNDSKRVIRALEMAAEGERYADRQRNLKDIEALYRTAFIGIDVDRKIIRDRIDERVDRMRDSGLVEEVQRLVDNGYRDAITSMQAIGYKEIIDALDGTCSLDDAFERIKTATKQYAKRQMTWFRHDKRIHWINGDNADIDTMTDAVIEIFNRTKDEQ